MFENAVLIASMIPDKKVREEKLPKLVFDEYEFGAWREETRRKSRLPRLFSRQRATNNGK
ncbi:MAG: hypothetical protein LC748_04575 [Thermomicrobia bacterium]|jgi:hypothetical protein|nr:hypothetical protein [Thermomicrobia bacterium]